MAFHLAMAFFSSEGLGSELISPSALVFIFSLQFQSASVVHKTILLFTVGSVAVDWRARIEQGTGGEGGEGGSKKVPSIQWLSGIDVLALTGGRLDVRGDAVDGLIPLMDIV